MFYARINKIKVFNNREGFLGLFNRRAELEIYSHVTAGEAGPRLALAGLAELPDKAARRQKLVDAVVAGSEQLARSHHLEVKGVKDNQALLFGEAGVVIYQSDAIPDNLDMQLWVIESDSDIREFALDAGQVIESAPFKGLLAAVETALAAKHPLLSGGIAAGSVVIKLLHDKLLANKDDLVGYWHNALNRAEHYPHGTRDKQDVHDTTGNILLDYTLFGFENNINSEQVNK